MQRLQCLPDLHLEANYRGGVSVRDRIVCADAAAKRILTGLQPSSDATVSAFPTATPSPLIPKPEGKREMIKRAGSADRSFHRPGACR